MQKSFTLITGGARSGKSSYAEKLAAELGEHVLYVATAQAFDDEMRLRIRNHQSDRPDHWQTLERPMEVGKTLTPNPKQEVILIDCVTLLVSNLVLRMGEDFSGVDGVVSAEIDAIIAAHQQLNAHFILVTNEVGLGIVPANKLSRIYRDALGRANQRLAAYASEVLMMVAGLPLIVKSS